MPEVYLGLNRKTFVRSAAKEATPGTYEAVDCMIRRSGEAWEMKKNFKDDKNLIGGTEAAGVLKEKSRKAVGSINTDMLTTHTLAFVGAFTGAISSAGTGYTKHSISPDYSSRILQTFSAVDVAVPGELNYQYGGCFLSGFTLELPGRDEFWKLDAPVLGFGNRSSIALPSSAEIEGSKYLMGGNTHVWKSEWTGPTAVGYDGTTQQSKSTSDIGANSATVTAITAKMHSLRFGVNLNIAETNMYQWNGGLVMSRANRGRYAFELSFTMELDGAGELDHLENGDTLSMEVESFDANDEIGSSGFYYGMNLAFPRLMIKDIQHQGGVDVQMINITAEVMDDVESTGYKAFYLDVYNDQAAYAA